MKKIILTMVLLGIGVSSYSQDTCFTRVELRKIAIRLVEAEQCEATLEAVSDIKETLESNIKDYKKIIDGQKTIIANKDIEILKINTDLGDALKYLSKAEDKVVRRNKWIGALILTNIVTGLIIIL